MVELILEHEQFGAHIVALLLENDAVLEHWAFERNQTKVVVFFEFTKSLGDEGDRALIVEHTAEWFI